MLDIEDISPFSKDESSNRNYSYSFQISPAMYDSIKHFIVEEKANLQRPWQDIENEFRTRYQTILSKKALRYVYEKEVSSNIPQSMVKCAMRSEHGVFVVSVVTSPYPTYTDEYGQTKKQRFSCLHKCVFCPEKKGFPKSYIDGEPGVDRAHKVDYDVVKQIHIRLDSYVRMGQTPDKLEIIVLGGTWSEYPKEYRDNVILDIYYGVNTYHVSQDVNTRFNIQNQEENSVAPSKQPSRQKLSLAEEIQTNETHAVHIIGLTLETRPDSITLDEIKTFREYNCTRVQIGIQHTDNDILMKIKRGHTIEDSMRAIKLLLDNGYKVDVHLMPNLPGSSVERDKAMIKMMLTDPRLRVDQWKVYPTSVVPWSILEKWNKQGKYTPYGDDLLLEFLLDMKKQIPEWIRLNRVVRDIPERHISGGCKTSHMRQLLHKEMKTRGIVCHCIRCRSVKSKTSYESGGSKPYTKVETYESSGGTEHFISHVSGDNCILFGFARLRIAGIPGGDTSQILDEIRGCALIRELHVYGKVSLVNPGENNDSDADKTQHRGIGRLLMAEAERIAIAHGFQKIAVISGVGVRNYYRKLGYELDQTFMMKQL